MGRASFKKVLSESFVKPGIMGNDSTWHAAHSKAISLLVCKTFTSYVSVSVSFMTFMSFIYD